MSLKRPREGSASANTPFRTWLSILISLPPLYTAITSYLVLLFPGTASLSMTSAPSTSSSLQRPVFLTWQISSSPSRETTAMNLFGRLRNVAFLVFS
jgi:hypothetical protein